MLRTMVMLGVFVLFEFGCVPWEGGGPQLDENVAASGRETNLRVSHLAVELEAGRPVSLCGGSNPKAGAVMAGLKDGELSVVRVDGSRKMVTVPLPETVMPGTAHVQAAGAFVLVEATVRRLDELGQPRGALCDVGRELLDG
jgi:hypothetical protein